MAAKRSMSLLQSIRSSCCQCTPRSAGASRAAIIRNRPHRQFSTSNSRGAIEAAPPINFEGQNAIPARIIPASPSYFTASPQFNDHVLLLQQLLRKYSNLPTIAPDQAPRQSWLKLGAYRGKVGEPVPASKYAALVRLLQRLNQVHSSLIPKEITNTFKIFMRPSNPYAVARPPQELDELGRSKAVGRRKESSAKVYLVEGDGEVLVNGKSLVRVFPRMHDRESALWALKVTQRIDKYNVWALVQGGGTTGQAEAITLALARALMVHEPALKPALRRGQSSVSMTFVQYSHGRKSNFHQAPTSLFPSV